MPPEHLAPDDPQEWLNRARSDLSMAQAEIPGVYLEDFCFHAQQAAEKALKALLIHRNIRFRYVHNVGELIGALEQAGGDVPETVREAASLTDFAVEARYPGLGEPVTPEERQQVVSLAEAIVLWVEQQIEA